MIWVTVSFWSCFCWLYRASPSSATKNIIALILVLTIWLYSCVETSLVLLEKFLLISTFSWQNSVIFCPASFCTPRPNLPVTPDISLLPTFAFQFPMTKRTSFFVCVCVSSRRSCRNPVAGKYWRQSRKDIQHHWSLRNENQNHKEISLQIH